MYPMPSRAAAASVAPDPFAAVTPATRQLYQQLLKRIKTIGPFRIETKKTSVHFTRKSAFAGVHPRKAFLMLTIKAAGPIDSERIAKAEQVSKSRWHLDIKVGTTQDIDDTLLAWLKQAYELCG